MTETTRPLRRDVLPSSCPPAGLRREEAAAYVGVSPSKFDDWVKRGLMPKPKTQDAVVIWVRRALDLALEALPDKGAANPWNESDAA